MVGCDGMRTRWGVGWGWEEEELPRVMMEEGKEGGKAVRQAESIRAEPKSKQSITQSSN